MASGINSILQRVEFFNGQRLFANDLNELDSSNRMMRELHNRSLHQPGVGSGFAVHGEEGEREVRIGPGYAIDGVGREIVNPEYHVESVPPVVGDEDGGPAVFELTVAYDLDVEESETRKGVCDSYGVVRRRESIVYCWVRLQRNAATGDLIARDKRLRQELDEFKRIRIAQVTVQNCQIVKVLVGQRTNAKPPTQPFIATNRLDEPPWKVAATHLNISVGGVFVHIITGSLRIDTGHARFRTTPSYAVRIEFKDFGAVQKRAFSFLEEVLPDFLQPVETPAAGDAVTPAFVAAAPPTDLELAFFEPLLVIRESTPALVELEFPTFAHTENQIASANQEKLEEQFKETRIVWFGME